MGVAITPYCATSGIIWSTNKPGIVSVDNNGLVEGLAVGSARITVKSDDEGAVSNYIDIYVGTITQPSITPITTILVQQVVIKTHPLYIPIGRSFQMSALIYPVNALRTLIWKSSNRKIATITEKSIAKSY
jgi:uncharacterized protein YjdB